MFAVLAESDAPNGHRPNQHVSAGIVRKVHVLDAAEVREAHEGGIARCCCAVSHRQLELDVGSPLRLLRLEVPLTLIGATVRAPAESDCTIRQHDIAVFVESDGLPIGIVGLAEVTFEIGRTYVAVRDEDRITACRDVLLQHDEHRKVGVATCVVVEIGAAPVEIEFLQDHVAHRHRERRVGALLRMQPEISEFGDFRVVRRDGDRLGALVAHLGEEVRVRRARLRDVAAPGDDERAVEPVGRFGHVGLLTPHLRTRRRQVAIPVVEAHAYAAYQRQVARSRCVTHHAHRRNRRKSDHTVGAVSLGRVNVRSGDDFVDLIPIRAHESPEPAHLLVVAPLGVVLHDGCPRLNRAVLEPRRAPVLQQAAAHHRMLDAVRAVQIPAVGSAASTTTRLVVRHVPARARVVGLLRLPRDDAAFDVDLPRARTCAVHAVGAAHDLVMRPAVAIGVFPRAVFARGHPVAIGELFLRDGEVIQSIEKMAHLKPPGQPFKGSSRTRRDAGRTTS